MNLWRHPNRPRPAERIVRECAVIPHDDGTISIAYLTPEQARLVRDAAMQSVKLYGLVYILNEFLGDTQEYEA